MQIDSFGGAHGVKDEGLLRSALAMPESGIGEDFFHKDIHEMAAAYLFHLVQNHPFHDGNKRIAAIAASVFIEINGMEIFADEKEFEKLVMDAAQGLTTKSQIADFFRSNSK
jgi:death-on-curing protein